MLKTDHLFTKYRIRVRIRDRILGGIPTTDEVGKLVDKLPPSAPVEERQKLAEEKITESTCTFLYDEGAGQYYIRDANVIAMLREAAEVRQLDYAARQLLQHGVSVKPDKIYLGENVAAEPLRKPIHVKVRGFDTPTIKINQYIEKPEFEFEIWVGKGKGKTKKVKVEDGDGKKKTEAKHEPDSRLTVEGVKDLVLTGTEVGMGACRSQQWGLFDVLEFVELG
jgi:hypothetical protein